MYPRPVIHQWLFLLVVTYSLRHQQLFDARISDAEGHRARVTPQGDLVTVLSQNPPKGGEILTVPFADFLTLEGEIG